MMATASRVSLVSVVLFAAALGGCGGSERGSVDEASAKRVGEIASQVGQELSSLKKQGCADPAAQRVKGLASELAERHRDDERTQGILAELMKSACPGVQAETVVALRRLRPSVEGRAPGGELADALATGLASPDAMVRTLSAMTVYELRIDPRGTRLPELLKGIAASDPDEKARATAGWVVERSAALFPMR